MNIDGRPFFRYAGEQGDFYVFNVRTFEQRYK